MAWMVTSRSCSSLQLLLVVSCVVAVASGHYTNTNCPPPPPSTTEGSCPRNALKLGVCANVLGLIKVGLPPPTEKTEPCCPLLDGLVDLEAAVCLCTALKANVLGIHINLPIDLSLVLNHCGKNAPTGFRCA